MRNIGYDIEIERSFIIEGGAGAIKHRVDCLEDFCKVIKDLPKHEKDLPWALYLSDNLYLKKGFDKTAQEYLPDYKMLNIVSHSFSLLDSNKFEKGRFPSRIIVSHDGKVPTIASLKKANPCGKMSTGCDKCEIAKWCYASLPENQDTPAVFVNYPFDYEPLRPFPLLCNKKRFSEYGITSDIVIAKDDCRLLYPEPENKDNVTENGMPKDLVDFFEPLEPMNIHVFLYDNKQKVK